MADYSFIDLHTHTIHSHENMCTNSVSDVLNDAQRIAERSGKDCLVAITDHNSVLGVIEARSILSGGKYDKVKLISGAEFTVSMGELNGIFGGHDVFKNTHILAYGFDENNKELIEYSKKAHSGGKVLKYSQLVNLVKNAGGYLVIAHPGLIKINQKGLIGYTGEKYKDEIADIYRNAKSSKTILRHIPNGKVILELFYERLKKLSGGILIGMERFHPDNYFKQFDGNINNLCERDNMIQTAGSDFHGYRLHTQFSVGNPFTRELQEFYKDKIKDCTAFRDGIHVSHLPGIELLTGEVKSLDEITDKEIRFISGMGEPITQEQYNQLVETIREEHKRMNLENDSGRYGQPQQKQPKKKGKKHKNNHKHKKKNKTKYYYPSEENNYNNPSGKNYYQNNDDYNQEENSIDENLIENQDLEMQ